MPITHPKEEKPAKPINNQSVFAFTKLPVDVKLSMMRTFLSTKELGRLARINKELRTLSTQCDNKEYLALTKGQKIINTAKKSLKPNNLLELLTLNDLESHYGLIALGEALLTIETIKQLKLDPLLKIICTSYGLTALREKLIDLSQVKILGGIKLRNIFTENGLVALRERLITPQQAEKLNTFTLSCLLSDKGISALKNRMVSIEQAKVLDINVLEEMVANVNLAAKINIQR